MTRNRQVACQNFTIHELLVICRLQLVNVGEDVLLFYNDKASFKILVDLMRSERHRMDPHSPLRYVQQELASHKPSSFC